jgi:hypothetical protein
VRAQERYDFMVIVPSGNTLRTRNFSGDIKREKQPATGVRLEIQSYTAATTVGTATNRYQYSERIRVRRINQVF